MQFAYVQVQALRSVEKYLNLDALYVLGTNCVDNGPRKGLEKFLNAASSDPDTVLHYEFMQVSYSCPQVCLACSASPGRAPGWRLKFAHKSCTLLSVPACSSAETFSSPCKPMCCMDRVLCA